MPFLVPQFGVAFFGPAMYQLYYHAQTRAIMITAKLGTFTHSTLHSILSSPDAVHVFVNQSGNWSRIILARLEADRFGNS